MATGYWALGSNIQSFSSSCLLCGQEGFRDVHSLTNHIDAGCPLVIWDFADEEQDDQTLTLTSVFDQVDNADEEQDDQSLTLTSVFDQVDNADEEQDDQSLTLTSVFDQVDNADEEIWNEVQDPVPHVSARSLNYQKDMCRRLIEDYFQEIGGPSLKEDNPSTYYLTHPFCERHIIVLILVWFLDDDEEREYLKRFISSDQTISLSELVGDELEKNYHPLPLSLWKELETLMLKLYIEELP